MAEFAAKNLPTMIASALDQQPRPWDALKVTGVLTTTLQRIHEEGPNLQSGGSTASVAIRLGNMLYLANVGDSATFLATYDDIKESALIIFETKRHKPDDPDERARIERHGGIIKKADPGPCQSATILIDGGKDHIAFSRALGDRDASSLGVIPDPTIVEIDLSPWKDKSLFAVSVTKGLFNVVPMKDIADQIARGLFVGGRWPSKLTKKCEDLVRRGRREWDNKNPCRINGADMSIAVHKI
jgi:serine/threonine protein phosphatase PrpC